VIECDGKRLGILTDLGHSFDGLAATLASVDAAYLESNYDADMLEQGPYPFHLKERIRGGAGHIGNHEAAVLLRACGRSVPNWIAVAHLSQENNHPELAIKAQRSAVGETYPVHHASRHCVSDVLEV
jgi:phosphoribosyl 1,2-cyclic phosphodiesterase